MGQEQFVKSARLTVSIPKDFVGYEKYSIVSEQLLPDEREMEIPVSQTETDPYQLIEEA